jgi:hypothetical protein
MKEVPTRIPMTEQARGLTAPKTATAQGSGENKRLLATGKKQWEKWHAETTPEERERIKQDLAKESARIRAIPAEIIAENIRSWQKAQQEEEKKKQAYISGKARFDPYVGEILKPGETPLHKTAIYHLTGKDAPRRFIPPVGSGTPGEETNVWHMDAGEVGQNGQENPDQERLIKRLLKAGWIEAAPTAQDWAQFALSKHPGSASPEDIIREWLKLQQELQANTPTDRPDQPKKDWLVELRETLEAMIRALINEQIEEDERKEKAGRQ